MALLWTFLENTTSSTDLNREFLTTSVTNKLAGLLLHILGCAGGLVDSLANFFSLSIANLLCWLVALPHCLVEGLLLEGDRTGLLKGLLADLLLGWSELGDIGVVALLRVLVGALQDRFLLQTRHCLLLLHTAQTGLRVLLAAAEVNPALENYKGDVMRIISVIISVFISSECRDIKLSDEPTAACYQLISCQVR